MKHAAELALMAADTELSAPYREAAQWAVDRLAILPAMRTKNATPTLSAALALPEVAALVEAAKGLLFAHDHGNGLEGWHNTRARLRAALAALEGRSND